MPHDPVPLENDPPEAVAGGAGSRPPEDRRRIRRVRRIARLLDTALGVPGTRIRFGLDAILGLVPGGGDVAGALLSAWIVFTAARMGVPVVVLLRMTGNLALDVVLGAPPLIGDLIDIGWKANTRNVALLERHLESPERLRRRSVVGLSGIAVALATLLGALTWGAWLALRGLATWLF